MLKEGRVSSRNSLIGLILLTTALATGTADAGCPWTGTSDTYTTVVRPDYLPTLQASLPTHVKVSVYNPSATMAGTAFPDHFTYSQTGFGLTCTPATPLYWEPDEDECEHSMSPPPITVQPGDVLTFLFPITSTGVNRISITWAHPDVGALVEATYVHLFPNAGTTEWETAQFRMERSGCY